MNIDNRVAELMKQEAELTMRKAKADRVIEDYLDEQWRKVADEITSLYKRQLKCRIEGNVLIDTGLKSGMRNACLCIRKHSKRGLFAVVVYRNLTTKDEWWMDSIWLDSGRKQEFCSLYSGECKATLNYLLEHFNDAKEAMEQSFEREILKYYGNRIKKLGGEVKESEAKADAIKTKTSGHKEKMLAMLEDIDAGFNVFAGSLISEADFYTPFDELVTYIKENF